MINVVYKGSHSLEEMALVGRTENNLEIVVWTNDPGMIPHFHIFDRNKSKNNEGCIRIDIDKPEYFSHNGKDMKLNSSQKKELIEFLENDFGRKKFTGTNWEFLVFQWNVNNSNIEIDDDTPMPDYRLLR